MTSTTSAAPRRPRSVLPGLAIGIDVRDADLDPAALEHVFDWFRFVDATFSTSRADSELNRVRRCELTLDEAHPDVRQVLDRCAELRKETRGAAGGDASGFVKGWSVDRAARILDAYGARNYAIDAGGDLVVRGRPAPAPHWRIAIKHPATGIPVAVVAATDLAIATTGARTGAVLSVTVVGPALATAGAYAAAAFELGENGPGWTAQLQGYEAMTILAGEQVFSTRGFPAAGGIDA